MTLLRQIDWHDLPASPKDVGPVAPIALPPRTESEWQPSARYSDQPMDWRTRLFGVGGVGLVALLIVGGALFTWTTYQAVPASSALAVFDVQPPASPAETPPEEKEAPKPAQKEEKRPEPQQVRPIEPPRIQISPVTVPIPVTVPRPPDPGPREPETAAPKTLPAPPAPQVTSNAADTWEGRVLAALNRKRRYPPWAMSRREQGVPYVRIVMDREGKVLSTSLERSSGFRELDREAMALPKRAAPLPKPPDDKRGETLELIVPIQFFLKG